VAKAQKLKSRTQSETPLSRLSGVNIGMLAWLLTPLLTFGFIINVRLFPMVAPNEEPKWALLVLCGIGMGLAGAWVLWQRRQALPFTWTWAGLALLVFYSILAIGIFIGPNTTEGLIRFAFWLVCLGVFLTVCWAWRHVSWFESTWVWLISLGSFVFSFRYWQGYFLDYQSTNYNISVLFSPIGHVNFTGDVLVVLLPVLVYLLVTQHHAVLRVLNWCSVFTVATVLLVASSRGALGGIVLGSLGVLMLAVRHRKVWLAQSWQQMSQWLPMGLVLTALLVSVVVYQMLPYHYRDLARLSGAAQTTNTLSMPLTANVLQPPLASMWHALTPIVGADRAPMYASANAMAWDAAWLGQGTGNFFAVYPSYSNQFPDFRDPLSSERTFTTNPHNVVLQIATQNGWIAALTFMGLLLLLGWRLSLSVWKKWQPWHATGVLAITAALFDSMFNHVFFNPASMFVFALMAGCWWATLPPMRDVFTLQLTIRMNKVYALGLLGALVLLSIWPLRWVVSEWYAGSATSHVRQPAMAAKQYQQAYAWNTNNFRAVFGVAQTAYQQKRFPEAIAYLKHFETIYPYNPPALNLLGAAYLMSGQYVEGIAAFKRAIAILPDFKMAQQNLLRAQALLQQKSQQTMQSRPAISLQRPK